jgi:hypothetical protein
MVIKIKSLVYLYDHLVYLRRKKLCLHLFNLKNKFLFIRLFEKKKLSLSLSFIGGAKGSS